MNNNKVFIVLILFIIFVSGCRKGTMPDTSKTFGLMKLELLKLPGTPDLDFYVEDKFSETVHAGTIASKRVLLEAEKETHVYFKLPRTSTSVFDTVVKIPGQQTSNFRLAFSEDLGMKKFLTGGGDIHPDSVDVMAFDNMDILHPDGVELIAELYREDVLLSGEFKLHYVFGKITKKQMTGNIVRLAFYHPDKKWYQYQIKYKNVATGQYMTDQTNINFSQMSFNTEVLGKTVILTLTERNSRGKIRFATDYAVL
jgi:hypothetical protein